MQADLVAERVKLALHEKSLVENLSADESENLDDDIVDKLQGELKVATEMAMLSMTTTGKYGSILDVF